MKYFPLGSRVLVQIETQTAGRTTESGVYLPGTERNTRDHARVIACGDEVELAIQPGLLVLINEYGGKMIETNTSQELVMLEASEIFAIIEE